MIIEIFKLIKSNVSHDCVDETPDYVQKSRVHLNPCVSLTFKNKTKKKQKQAIEHFPLFQVVRKSSDSKEKQHSLYLSHCQSFIVKETARSLTYKKKN